jgi:hypothetical protein
MGARLRALAAMAHNQVAEWLPESDEKATAVIKKGCCSESRFPLKR